MPKRNSRQVRADRTLLDRFKSVATARVRSRGFGLEAVQPPSDSAAVDLALGIAARTLGGEYERMVIQALDADVTREVSRTLAEVFDRAGVPYETRQRPDGGPEFIVEDGGEGIAIPTAAVSDMLAARRKAATH